MTEARSAISQICVRKLSIALCMSLQFLLNLDNTHAQSLGVRMGGIFIAETGHLPLSTMTKASASNYLARLPIQAKSFNLKAMRGNSRLAFARVRTGNIKFGETYQKLASFVNPEGDCRRKGFTVQHEGIYVPIGCLQLPKRVYGQLNSVNKKELVTVDRAKLLDFLFSIIYLLRDELKDPSLTKSRLSALLAKAISLASEQSNSIKTEKPVQNSSSGSINTGNNVISTSTQISVEPSDSSNVGGNLVTQGLEDISSSSINSSINTVSSEAFNPCDSKLVMSGGGCKFGANGSNCYAASSQDPSKPDLSTVCINQHGANMPFKSCENQLVYGRNCAEYQARDSRCSVEEFPDHPYISSWPYWKTAPAGIPAQGTYCCSAPTVGGALPPAAGVDCKRLDDLDKYDHSQPIDPESRQPNQTRVCNPTGDIQMRNCGTRPDNSFGNGTCGWTGTFAATKPVRSSVVAEANCCSGKAEYISTIHDYNGMRGFAYTVLANFRCCGDDGEPDC